jgi:catechol 2,3-dioxygenase-like lactoylglutathione lyase family enzyme
MLEAVIQSLRDLEAAAERTAALLGRPASWRGVHPGNGTANALFRLENGYLELLAAAGEGPLGEQVAAFLEQRGEGQLALALGTPDLAACVAALRERGVQLPEPTDGEGRRDAAAPGDAGAADVRRWSSVLLPVDASRGLPLLLIQHHSPEDALPLRAPSAPAAAAIAGFDHAVVLSGDLAAAGALYGDTLGLRLALDRRFEARQIRILFFRLGGVTVEVAGALAGGDAESPDRFGGLAYRVPDVAAARQRLADAAFDVSEVRGGFKPGTRVCTVRDGTCGVPTLLIEPAPAG